MRDQRGHREPDGPARGPGRPVPAVRPLHSSEAHLAGPHLEHAGALSWRYLRTILHELSNMIDGSTRYLSLAQRALAVPEPDGSLLDNARRHVDIASQSMHHVIELMRSIRPILEGGAVLTDPRLDALAAQEPVARVIRQAVDVLRPMAEERRIRIHLAMAPDIQALPAAPLYPVVTNAIRNAIEAIDMDGHIEVSAHVDRTDVGATLVCIDVLDDGPGPPEGRDAEPFRFGYSTKAGGSGIGLALAQSIIEELRGTITLSRRDDAPTGAHLAIRYPVTEDMESLHVT